MIVILIFKTSVTVLMSFSAGRTYLSVTIWPRVFTLCIVNCVDQMASVINVTLFTGIQSDEVQHAEGIRSQVPTIAFDQ